MCRGRSQSWWSVRSTPTIYDSRLKPDAQHRRDKDSAHSYAIYVADVEDELIRALKEFLSEALSIRDSLIYGVPSKQAPPAPEAFAKQLSTLPSASVAESAALQSARVNGYIIREGAPVNRREAGRVLSAEALIDTGLLDCCSRATQLTDLRSPLSLVPIWQDPQYRFGATQS